MKNIRYIMHALMLCFAQFCMAQNTTGLLKPISRDTTIVTLQQDRFTFSRAEYNQLIELFPSLIYDEFPNHPDLSYTALMVADSDNNFITFTSEAGKDNYYRLYAHFLAQHNGIKKYAEQRKRLNALFDAINTLYTGLYCGGGTFQAHRQARIPGYAEYAVYQYSLYENDGAKRYSIGPQKKHYIALLRQVIADEMMVDDDRVDCAASRKIELEDLVNAIDTLIDDGFYLQQALAFQYSTIDL